MKSSEIRKTFLDFFKSKEHKIVPSAPLVIKDDPTLMFTNAGMNQFKDYFLGNKKAEFPRVADTQKCLRVSGKHNDLEEVGVDTYHHTMFEMLGNWSFGDYFKEEAISWAWELLTEVYKVNKDRLYVTVFEGDKKDGLTFDQEAYDCWKKHLPEERILNGNKKDNFWEMGDVGPCGPCSEIHIDLRSDEERKKIDGASLVNRDHPEVIEIWNNVFMEFNRLSNGSLEQLPNQHVDTGMGFERLSMVLQNKRSSYDTDVFSPLISKVEAISKKKYISESTDSEQNKINIAIRVIVDHVRAISFSIADGQLPSNTGAGYVIRRILRRAVRYGYQTLGMQEPFMCELAEVLVKQMGEAFPELKKQQSLIEKVIKEEEVSFLKTLASGISRFNEQMERQKIYSQLKEFYSQHNIKVIFNYVYQKYSFDIYFPDYKFALEIANFSLNKTGINSHMDKKGFYDIKHQHINTSVTSIEEIKTNGLKLYFIPDLVFKYDPNLSNSFSVIHGQYAFELYDTYGFPIDLTQLIAKENGFTVDIDGFNKSMQDQKNRSKSAAAVDTGDWIKTDKSLTDKNKSLTDSIAKMWGSKFVGYDKLEQDVKIIQYRKVKTKSKEFYQLVFSSTPFYAESGGQVGDTGYIQSGDEKIKIINTKKENGLYIHITEQLPTKVNSIFKAVVNKQRRKLIANNHSATHLLHAALREVLGDHVEQKGSLVNENYLRFDFSHFSKVSDEELKKIEALVNSKIHLGIEVNIDENIPIEEAKKKGAMALFGEKYGDSVRVVSIDPSYSIELCGGTHVNNTAELGLFKIVSESAVAAGIRRIEAITSLKAEEYVNEKLSLLEQVNALLKHPKDVIKSLSSLMQENAELQKQLEAVNKDKAKAIKEELKKNVENINGTSFISKTIDLDSSEDIKNIAFELKREIPDLFMVLGAIIKGKPSITVAIGDELVKSKSLNAGNIVRELAKEIKGGGGGQPFFATAGGSDASGLDNAIKKAAELLHN